MKYDQVECDILETKVSILINCCNSPKETWSNLKKCSPSVQSKSWLMEVREPHKIVPNNATVKQQPKGQRLAVSTTKARDVALSTVRASIRKGHTRTRMSCVCRVAAEHPDSGTKFGTAQRDHVLARHSVSYPLKRRKNLITITGYEKQQCHGDWGWRG